LLAGGVRQQTGDEAVGELPEGVVNLGLQLREGRGIGGELVGPGLLLSGEVDVDLLEGLVGGRYVGASLRVEAEAHGKSFRVMPLLLCYNSRSGRQRHHFLGMSPT